MNQDPEEAEILGPHWAHLHPRDEEFLFRTHHEYLQLTRVASKRDLRYVPPSRVLQEGDLVAWTSVSPSQIENYTKCHRLWFFKSVMRLPELQKGNQALGEGVHLIIENVEKVAKGEMPRLGYEYAHSDVPTLDAPGWERATALASLLVPYIPRSVGNIQVLREQKITLPTYPGGPTMLGYMDLGVPPGIGWPQLMIPKEAAIIGDYKTLSDFKYMKTPEELAANVQMMTYAKWSISDMPTPRQDVPVYLAHLYGRTKPPFTKSSVRSSVACVTPEQINTFWENKILDTVRSMDHDAKANDAQDVEATGVFNDHCSAYGGCAYRDRCGLNQPNPIANLFSVRKSASSSPTETKDMSEIAGGALAQKLAALRARGVAEATGQAAPVAPAPVQTPAPAPVVQTPAPVVQAPAPAPAPSAAPSSEIQNKGPVSLLLIEIAAKNNGSKPSLSGLVALLYAKEQSLEFKSGATLAGSGSVNLGTCRTMSELVALNAKSGAAAAPVTPTVASGIVPADAPARTQPVISQPGDGVDPIKANSGSTGDTPAGVTEEEDGEETAQESAPAVAGGPPPVKRGRRTNAEIAAEKAAEAAKLEAEIERRVAERLGQISQVDAVASGIPEAELLAEIAKIEAERDQAIRERDSLEKKVNASHKIGGGAQPRGFVLYVDCYPTKGAPEGIQDYLEFYAPCAQLAAEQNNVTDWRMIDYKGKGILATIMRLAAQDLPAAMSISSYMPGADVALEILSPLAREIIRKI